MLIGATESELPVAQALITDLLVGPRTRLCENVAEEL